MLQKKQQTKKGDESVLQYKLKKFYKNFSELEKDILKIYPKAKNYDDFYSHNFVVKTGLFLITGVIALTISCIYSKLEYELKDKEDKDKLANNQIEE